MSLVADNQTLVPAVRYLYVTGHLRPGVSLASTHRGVKAIAVQRAKEYPGTNATWSVWIMTVRNSLIEDLRQALLLLVVMVVLILLISCSNVANRLLTLMVRQRCELELRSALGAARGRLTAQIVTESTLLALLGGTLGI